MSKPLLWVGSSKRDLMEMPTKVKRAFGHGLNEVQEGRTPEHSKAFTQVGGGVMEIVEDHDRNTYRAIYTAKLSNAVYVLHCFQKKSKSGIATPKPDVELMEQRLKMALEHSRQAAAAVSKKTR
jgi:phage-related protein